LQNPEAQNPTFIILSWFRQEQD